MKDLRQRLLATFQIEHAEHVQRIRESLAAFESDASVRVDIDDVFRRAHSLKGAARAVDLRPLESLAHRLETLLAGVREGTMPLDARAIKVIYQGLDASEDWLAASTGAEEPAAPTEALAAIDSLLGTPSAATAPRPAPAAAVAPASASPAPQAASVAPAVPAAPVAPAAPAAAPVVKMDSLRLNAASLDRIGTSAGQLLTESLRQSHVTSSLHEMHHALAEAATERDRVRKSGARIFQKLDSSPELTSVARYVNYIDHQIQRLTKQVGAATQLQERNAWTLRSLAGELQRDVRSARMVPAENIFDGFRKMVRDLAKEAGKKVDLHVTGWQTEADRLVLQALRDPVMHMLRNALDHGIEREAERKAAGKPADARIDLTIEARGNRLNITVEDDGRGIDVARVSEAAVRKGLIAEHEVAQRSPAELTRLILLPGFSTSRSVTELSGRGMGLSVVAQAVARLQGKVDIGAGALGGTRVTISAPLSISSHRVLLVRCQGQTLAVPFHGIERLLRVKLSDVQTVAGRPVVTIDSVDGHVGRPVPVASLAHLLNAAEPRVSVTENVLCLMLMEAGAARLAVAVDAFVSERDAVVKDLPSPADANAQIAGGVLLEDGTVCLVLNPAELVEGFQQSSTSLVLAVDAQAPADENPSLEILVVDDSLTTRTLEKSVLEAHGYQVATAVDGMDALGYLRANRVRLVISDLEMPRLDGFGLLGEMKGDPRLSKIPVIIVSSIESPEEQARGMTLGADAYVVKRKFDQQELLETISRSYEAERMKKIGVLVVEDSAVVQQLLEHIIGTDPRLTIVAMVATAEEALEMLPRLSPDIISLDIRLPGMNGLEATRRIMQERPTPIVVCSASVESDDLNIAMTALRAGALAVVEKPVGSTRDDYERLARTLCTQLVIMSDVKVVRQRSFTDTRATAVRPDGAASLSNGPARRGGAPLRLLGIGASTGGPNAVVRMLGELGPDFPLPILLVQHMMPSFIAGFASWLEGVTPFRAVLARTGDLPMPGTVYMAPADYHLQLEAGRIRLTQEPPASLQRPSATILFRSMAKAVGNTGLGVLLTGMGDDGADGLLDLRRAGGHTLAEHESTAVVYGMPKAAVDRGAVCECLPLGDIAARVRELVLVSVGEAR